MDTKTVHCQPELLLLGGGLSGGVYKQFIPLYSYILFHKNLGSLPLNFRCPGETDGWLGNPELGAHVGRPWRWFGNQGTWTFAALELKSTTLNTFSNNFHSRNIVKQTTTTTQETTVEELFMVLSVDSKVRTTLYSILNSTTEKYCSIAFIWTVTLKDFIPQT